MKSKDGSEVAVFFEQYSVAGEFIVAPDGEKSYFISDHQGNVRCKFNKKEAKSFDYTPFGAELHDNYNDPQGWIASERDAESNYMNLGFRLYDPVIGRFLSVDPLAELQIGITPYHYCGNDPVNGKDPSGLCSDCGEDCVIGPFYGNVNGGDNKKGDSDDGSWVDKEIHKNDCTIYGIMSKFNSHSADQLLVSHNGQNATTDIRILIPYKDKDYNHSVYVKYLTVSGKINNPSTFAMNQDAYDGFLIDQQSPDGLTYGQLQGSLDNCIEIVDKFHQIIGEFDLIPNAYTPCWETAFVSDGINTTFGISNKDCQAPNATKSINTLLSMCCSAMYVGHSHCNGANSYPYEDNQVLPSLPNRNNMGDYSIFNNAAIGVIMRPKTVTFYNNSNQYVIPKAYLIK